MKRAQRNIATLIRELSRIESALVAARADAKAPSYLECALKNNAGSFTIKSLLAAGADATAPGLLECALENNASIFTIAALVAAIADAKEEILVKYSKGIEYYNYNKEEKVQTCPICLEALVENITNIKLLECKHLFCLECYNKTDKKTCPCCRTKI